MKDRRDFLKASILAAAIPSAFVSATSSKKEVALETSKELYEIRSYEMKFGGNAKALIRYLKNDLHPALKEIGIDYFQLFQELGKEEPAQIKLIISYPSADTYIKAASLISSRNFRNEFKSYHTLASHESAYNRISSSLLLAFDGIPKMKTEIEGASLFELRTYEGFSEDAVARKIAMFNDEELPLFDKVGLHPSFFGEMLIGPYCPSLVYMLNFKNMEQRNENWSKFIKHPDWNSMKAKPIYADTVSNIRKVFLEKI